MMRALALFALLVVAACDGAGWQPSATCGRGGATCTTHADCCSYACIGGACECAPTGQHCLADIACCDGNSCVDETCVAGCRDDGHACGADGDCCSNICDAGVCTADPNPGCIHDGYSCSTTEPCCAGLECHLGSCEPLACAVADEVCTPTKRCCAGFACSSSGRCQACSGSTCCSAQDAPCYDSSSCCAPLTCSSSSVCAMCGVGGATCFDMRDCCNGRGCYSNRCCGNYGESCTTDQQCCDQNFGKCGGQQKCCLDRGGTCTNPADCCSGICTGGTCAPTPVGSPCSDPFECASYPNGGCTNGLCCLATFQTCSANAQCCSGVCKQNNTCQ